MDARHALLYESRLNDRALVERKKAMEHVNSDWQRPPLPPLPQGGKRRLLRASTSCAVFLGLISSGLFAGRFDGATPLAAADTKPGKTSPKNGPAKKKPPRYIVRDDHD